MQAQLMQAQLTIASLLACRYSELQQRQAVRQTHPSSAEGKWPLGRGLHLNGDQPLHILSMSLLGLQVPKHNAGLGPVGLGKGVHNCASKVAPVVAGLHVCKIHKGLDCERNAQATLLPCQCVDARSWHPQCANMLPCVYMILC